MYFGIQIPSGFQNTIYCILYARSGKPYVAQYINISAAKCMIVHSKWVVAVVVVF